VGGISGINTLKGAGGLQKKKAWQTSQVPEKKMSRYEREKNKRGRDQGRDKASKEGKKGRGKRKARGRAD